MKVKDLMRTNVVTLHVSDTLDVAEDIMKMGRIRHLPVVEANKHVVGMVSQRDLFRASISSVLDFAHSTEEEWLKNIKVKDVMSDTIISIGSEAGVLEAVEKFMDEKFGCLPVVDDDQVLVGLLTETDCLRCFHDLLKAGTFKELLS